MSVQRREPGSPPGTRCEVKNLNGVRFLQLAIESEVSRQIALLSSNQPVFQATRGFDVLTSSTFHLRSKEDAPDYRYMPDPELGAVVVSDEELEGMRKGLPELPEEAYERLTSQYGLSGRDSGILVALGESLGDEGGEHVEGAAAVGVRFFEQVADGRDAKIAANWSAPA